MVGSGWWYGRQTGPVKLHLLPEILFFSVLSEEAGSGGNVDTERKAAVKTIPTLGHQPVILGGLYSAVEDEFLPGM